MATSQPGTTSGVGTGPGLAYPPTAGRPPGLLSLPGELIDAILAYMSPLELAKLSYVCRKMRSYAVGDLHWRRHVQSSIPGNKVTSPFPCATWLELYGAHHQHWFLTKHKLWFCDHSLTGQLIVVRYDQRRGCIEGYQLVATRTENDSEPWLEDSSVHIHHFNPQVALHLDRAVLQFNTNSLDNLIHSTLSPRTMSPFSAEQTMRYENSSGPNIRTFFHAKPLDGGGLERVVRPDFPYGMVWPPPTIPARDRVLGWCTALAGHAPPTVVSSPSWRPSNRGEASDMTFRIRQWMHLGRSVGFPVGEEFDTYATLDPALYTPTATKPWRGIWVGDYSSHGCEFILIHQPDLEEEAREEPLIKLDNETDDEFQARFLAERVYRGELKAIKLTGDDNVPRGEYTFTVDDLGAKGYLGDAKEPPFQGARMVQSKGHLAGRGFTAGMFIGSQLIIVSHNRLAHYWVELDHISFFERVDIDQFLVPQ
ncbi:hypothetical protein GGS20DRAFT_590915 [Poronia punctata]|nr:hypothetical protein GGS20DRAFT_590915 [Poronia punctata]